MQIDTLYDENHEIDYSLILRLWSMGKIPIDQKYQRYCIGQIL